MVNKVSEITYENIADYIRLNVSSDLNEQNNLKTYLNISKDFISNYTGIAINKYIPTEDTTYDSTKTYYYKDDGVYVKFTGSSFVEGTIYYEKIFDEDIDDYADFVIVVYVLCQDMYDNRSLYVDKTNLNKVVETILNMHTRVNLK